MTTEVIATVDELRDPISDVLDGDLP